MKELIAKCSLIALLVICIVVGLSPTTADAEEDGLLITAIPLPTTNPKETEKLMWEQLKEAFGNEVAPAAIMGNLRHESGLCTYRYEGLTIEESENLNAIYRDDECKFVYSERGYGLAGWTGTTNLEKLWDFCEENGCSVDDPTAQIEFLINDLKETKPNCYERLLHYGLKDLVTATEDFRQSYEKSSNEYQSKWYRATYAKDIFTSYCEDVTDIKRIALLPMDFEITERVKEMNKKYELS